MPSPLFPASPLPSPVSASKEKDQKGVNVQVVLRCRPFNEEELRTHPPQVILCNEARREVTVTTRLIDRAFTFDKVFGQQAQQKDLYDQAISPLVYEVLEGFNCTVFAYGQTGTGKTYTMEGAAKKSKNAGELPADAGVIPRAVEQIFHALEGQNAEYSMKVTFLELYNEEIMDLLAPDEVTKSMEEKQRKPLALMEDGKGGVLVRGLEEEIVYSANEIFSLLERGSSKRRTAETLLNKQSSRSHSIFSIIIHIKESGLGGEELIKCGRLNLVDLAGSESISRSGAREGRAREAGEINKSLLTLGRVITALVEHLGHVPYRDSKLTRLLRESLGGKAKTCIIATIAPSLPCLEETLSTLDYAYRAKSIKNKPEVNQKLMKSALIKDFYLEIERLKTEVLAAREKNGIYLPRDRYVQEEAEKKAMSDKLEQMESAIQAKDKQLEEMQASLDTQGQLCESLSAKLEATEKQLEQTEHNLVDAKEKIKEAHFSIKQREYAISKLQQSEKCLVEKAVNIQSDLENSVDDIEGLYLKIDRKDTVESQNHKLVQDFHLKLGQQLEVLRKNVASSVAQQQQQFLDTKEQLTCFVARKEEISEGLNKRVLSLKDTYCCGLKGLNVMIQSSNQESSSRLEKLNSTVSTHSLALEELLSAADSQAELLLRDLQTAFRNHEAEIQGFTQQLQKGALQNIEASRAISRVTIDFFSNLEKSTSELCQALHRSHQAQKDCIDKLEDTYQDCSKKEEEQLIRKFAEMLAATTARKAELVRSNLKQLRESGSKDFSEMECGMLDMHGVSSKARIKWQGFMCQTEAVYAEHSAGLSAKSTQLQALLHECVKSTNAAREQWRGAQASLQQLEKGNLAQVDSIVKEGLSKHKNLLTKFEESNASINSSIGKGYLEVLECIEGSLNHDRGAGAEALSSCSIQTAELTRLQASHHSGTSEIEGLALRCFNEDYMEDTPTCTTPKKRAIVVPSQASIDALRAPDLEKMLGEFQEANHDALRAPDLEKMLGEFQEANHSPLPDKGGVQTNPIRETKIPIFADSSLLLRDGRVPLTTVN